MSDAWECLWKAGRLALVATDPTCEECTIKEIVVHPGEVRITCSHGTRVLREEKYEAEVEAA